MSCSKSVRTILILYLVKFSHVLCRVSTFSGWHLLSLYIQKYYDPALTTSKLCFPSICLFSKFFQLDLHRTYTRAIRNLHILHEGIIPSHLADKTLCIPFLNFKEVMLSFSQHPLASKNKKEGL